MTKPECGNIVELFRVVLPSPNDLTEPQDEEIGKAQQSAEAPSIAENDSDDLWKKDGNEWIPDGADRL